MPENDADACVGEGGGGSCLHPRTFYGEAAQLRNRPPRVAMSRLTANNSGKALPTFITISPNHRRPRINVESRRLLQRHVPQVRGTTDRSD